MNFVFFVCISEQSANVSLRNIKILVFITEVESAYCAVRQSPYITQIRFVFKELISSDTGRIFNNLNERILLYFLAPDIIHIALFSVLMFFFRNRGSLIAITQKLFKNTFSYPKFSKEKK